MSQGIKAFPRETESFSSVRDYQQVCESFAGKLGKHLPDWNQATVANRSNGDQNYQILYTDKHDDFYCSANVDWYHRQMEVKAGLLSQKKNKHVPKKSIINQTLAMTDACALTRGVVGEGEFAGQVCEDERLDPRLENMTQYHSAKLFLQRCEELQSNAAILSVPPKITSDKIRVVDEARGDAVYGLLYENPENNFFCEGIVDSLQHALVLRHGLIDNFGTADPTEAIAMTDSCSMTEGLLGKDELGGVACTDREQWERDREFYLGLGLHLVGGYIGMRVSYKIARSILKRPVPGTGLPVYRHLATAYLAASFFDAAAGLFLDQDDPFRQYGTLAAGAAGLFAPNAMMRGMSSLIPQTLRAGIATRLAAQAGKSFWGGMARGAGKGFAGTFLVYGLNYAWSRWITDSDYQSSLNKRVSDQVYEDDDVYDLKWYDIFVVPAIIKGVRGGARWLAPDMMNSAITWDNDELEDKFRAEDLKGCEAAEDFIAQYLPPLLSYDSGKDPNTTVALLRDEVIKMTPAEEEASAILFNEGAQAVMEKFKLSQEKIEDLAYKAILKKVQEAGAWLAFVDGDRNAWAREIFNRDGTLKASLDSQGKHPVGTLPYQVIQNRFPYTPEPKEFWVDLIDGKKVPAFESLNE